MNRPWDTARQNIRALLLGVLIGFGTNLVTANPNRWPGWLQPVDEYAPFWLPTLVLGVVAHYLLGAWRKARRHPWAGNSNPYPGLEAFGEDRAGVFFGREQETRELVERLARPKAAAVLRFVPVIGPSGSGKSSLLNAGVTPALRRSGWAIPDPVLPGADPITTLVTSLTPKELRKEQRLPEKYQTAIRHIRIEADRTLDAVTVAAPTTTSVPPPRTLLGLLTAARGHHRRLLLVVDQLEETVSRAVPRERQAFLAVLQAALDADPRLHVLTSVRVESLGTFQQEPNAELFAHPYGLGALPPERLRHVVRKPAQAAGMTFEEDLVEEIVADTTGADALPLLGHLLRQLYDQAGDHKVITRVSYEQAGRVAGAVAAYADRVLGDLGALHPKELGALHPKEAVLEMLLDFVAWEGPEPTRRRVARSELDEVAWKIVNELRESRLVVEVAGQDALDLAHEALLRQWQPLADLIRAREQALRQRTELEQLARIWDRYDRPPNQLLSGSRLREAQSICGGPTADGLVVEFVRASAVNERTYLETIADHVARQAAHALGAIARDDGQGSDLRLALAHAAVRECAPTPYACLVLTAGLAQPIMATIGDIADEDAADEDTADFECRHVSPVAWSPDGRLAGFSYYDVKVWDPLVGSQPIRLFDQGDPRHRRVRSLAWSPDGRLVATTDGSGLARVWDLAGDEPIKLADYTHETRDGWGVSSVAWSPDGRLACATGQGVWVRNPLADGEPIKLDHDSYWMWSVAWSPDGRLAYLSGEGAWVWEVAGGRPPKLHSHVSGRRDGALAWSPDGRLATSGLDGSVQVWDSSGHELFKLYGHELSPSYSVAWSPDGRRLASAGADGIWVWDLSSRDSVRLEHTPLDVDHTNFTSMRGMVAWAPSSRLATVSSGSHALRVWDLNVPLEELLAQAKVRDRRPLTADERRRYFLPPHS